jgi:recombination protein RecA
MKKMADKNTATPLRSADPKEAKAREAALDAAVIQIEKQFGQGSVMRLGDDSAVQVEAIPTGALSLDLALGVGGVPRGRIVEIFGPESSGKTTLVYHIIAEAQARGGVCAFVDAEHAIDPIYAKRIGVDTDELLVSQPDYGEQALEIVDVLVRSGAVDVVAIDSVAALTPRVELEGQMGETQVGLQARLMSQALRKLAGNLNRASTVCLFTNQIREKIGVMFGCFFYDARVVLADGSTEKIGKIVNQRLPVEVMSMDPETGEISPRRIVEYHNNGKTDEWLQFEVAAAGGSGKRKLACTPNHLIFTSDGEKPAAEIQEGDDVLVAVKHYDLREDQLKLIIGSALGDGSLRYASDYNVAFRVGHGSRQREYCEWKREMLAPFAHELAPTGAGIGFDTIPMHQLRGLHDGVYAKAGGRTISDEVIEQLDARAVAAWYCDDGSFSGTYERWGHGKAVIYCKALSHDDKERVAARLDEAVRLAAGRAAVRRRRRLAAASGVALLVALLLAAATHGAARLAALLGLAAAVLAAQLGRQAGRGHKEPPMSVADRWQHTSFADALERLEAIERELAATDSPEAVTKLVAEAAALRRRCQEILGRAERAAPGAT